MKTKIEFPAAAMLLAVSLNAFGQIESKVPRPSDGVWQAVEADAAKQVRGQRSLLPRKFRALTLNRTALDEVLVQAPREFSEAARLNPAELALPMPDGTFARFRVVESPIMEPDLAARFPEIKTYCGQGVDDPAATVRCGTSPRGFHAQVLSPNGAVQIEPAGDAGQTHLSFYQRDVPVSSGRWECGAAEAEGESALSAPLSPPNAAKGEIPPAVAPPPLVMLRTYRLAVAATGEYTAYHGGTVTGTMGAIVSTINQVNAIFERDLAIRLVLVANNDLIVFTNAATDPYTTPRDDASRNAALAVNQFTLDTFIGPANYDLGYLFGVGISVANTLFGTVCVSGSKASGGLSFLLAPEGLPFVQGTVHEFGHLFNANHSFNGCVNRVGSVAFEPGSGSTLMCYAGACGSADNLQPMRDSYFHSGTLDEVNAFVTTGSGRNCVVAIPTGNHAPVVSAGPNFAIPKGTPFALTATGSDVDGDPLTYCWEERDLGPAQPATGPGSADSGSSPLFRSFLPTSNPTRTFPRLSDILNNTATIGEQLPATSRTMRFRVTARDNHAGAGGVAAAEMQITVATGAGPFLVTSPATNVIWSGVQTVTWNVAGTTNAPILATNVNIRLSTNGGLSFPITLAANTPNDGAESVTLPDVYAAAARIKVEAVGNLFFDISKPDFILVPAAPVLVKVGASLLAEDCPPTNGVIDPGETVIIQTVFQNIGAADATGLAVTLLAGGGVLSPSPAQTNATATAGGGLATNTFTFTAFAGLPCGGTMIPTCQLRVGSNDAGTASFSFPLGKTALATTRVANSNAIRITSGLPGSPYPSRIEVAGVPDAVGQITATLSNLTHQYPGDLDVLLVGPGGQAVLLMSDTAFGPANHTTLTFDNGAPFSLDEVTQPVSGVYKLTLTDNESYPDFFPLPAPSGPYARKLSVFNGTAPNGTWRLYVNDNYPNADGITAAIAGGWQLEITTSNTACCSSVGLALTLTDSPDPVPVGSNLTYSITVGNVSPTEATGVIVSNPLSSGVVFVSAVASQGSCANNSGLVTCNLGTLAAGATATVNLVVTPSAAGTITNTASVTRAGAGTNPVSNTATVLTTISPFPSLSIADAALAEGNTGTNTLLFPVSLAVASAQPVTVSFATADGSALAGSDYVATNGTLIFNPGETVQTISVPVPGDTLRESNKTFAVILGAPTNAVIEDGLAVGTIRDNDFVALSIVNASVVEGNEGLTNADFVVRLSAISGATVTANYYAFNNTATAGTDFVATNGTISFPPGTTNQTVTVPVLGDLLNEANETFRLQIVSANYATLPGAAATGTIINDDALPGLTINDVAVAEGNAGTSLAVFNVSLTPASGRSVTVAYATANDTATAGADYAAKSGSLSFPIGATNLSLAITISGDRLAESNEAFFVNLTSPVNATVADAQAVGTILNDELWLTAIALAGGDVRLSFFTESNKSYRVERTDSLSAPINWSPVPGATNVAGTGGAVEMTDPAAANQPQQFYRVALRP